MKYFMRLAWLVVVVCVVAAGCTAALMTLGIPVPEIFYDIDITSPKKEEKK